MTTKNKLQESFLPAIALFAMLIGLIGSLYFMFKAGSNQKSILLIGLFTGWVVSPFAALFIASKKFKYLFVHTISWLHWFAIVLSFSLLAVYSGAFTIASQKPAAKFLIVPLLSWLLIITSLLIARRIARKSSATAKK